MLSSPHFLRPHFLRTCPHIRRPHVHRPYNLFTHTHMHYCMHATCTHGVPIFSDIVGKRFEWAELLCLFRHFAMADFGKKAIS